MKVKKEYLVILTILITEVLGFSLILPFLPFYAQEFGATPLEIGLILTSFSFFQFFSAPIMGRLSDHYGRKPLLIISQFSTFIGFLILGFANALWMIFLSRIVDGLFGSNFTIAQAYLSDISSKEDRSKVFGLSGVAFGLGFLVGPAIGGFLSAFGFSLPSFLAAAVSAISMLIIFFFLPETIKRKKEIKLDIKIFHFNDFRKYFSDKLLSPKFWQFFTYVFAHTLWVSTSALYAQAQLGFTAIDVGLFLTYVGLISVIIRGILLSKLIDLFGEKNLQYMGAISIIVGMVASAFVAEAWMFYIIITFFSFGSGVLRPVLQGTISRGAPQEEQGSVLGITNSLGSISQIFGPVLGGFLINYFIPGSLGLMAAFIMSLGLVMMFREEIKNNEYKHEIAF
jgi:DHA1 family tetracycline resistance protein-like MFS transporter